MKLIYFFFCKDNLTNLWLIQIETNARNQVGFKEVKVKSSQGTKISFLDHYKLVKLCHSSCKTCFGTLINNCISCPEDSYLYYYQCLKICPKNFYFSKKLNNCSEIKNCSEKNKFFNIKTEICVSNCNNGTFLFENICYSCHENCLTCNGISKYQCLSCTKDKIQVINNFI